MPEQPFSLDFPAGIQRDGTAFDSKKYLDALWCRFRLGRPRKMGGYQTVTDAINGVGRKIHCFYTGNNVIVHIGHSRGLQQVTLDQNGNLIGIADRTPATFAGGIDPGWTFDAMFNATASTVELVAHCNSNISQIASTVETAPFIGQIDIASPLVPFVNPGLTDGSTYTPPSVAGGVFCVQPYVCDFNSNGFVGWSAPLLPNTLGITGGDSTAGNNRVSAQKIVAGMALRGGGIQSPAGLVWSLSELIGFVFNGTTAVWTFSTISPSSSILAGATVVEYDGLYFWAGTDRFLVFNGTVNEVPNPYNQDWFFDNINRTYAGRSFAFKVPRYGEIWFCAPLFNSTECNYAAIYNVRENCWYDTALPNGGRGAAYFAQGFPYPIMSGVTSDTNGFSLWTHETGTDEINLSGAVPINSYFDSPYIGGAKNDPASNQNLSIQTLEPDLEQTGDMSVSIYQQANAKAPLNLVEGPIVIPQTPGVPQEEIIGFKKSSGRLTRIRIQSNVLGGNYISGRNLLHAEPGEERITS